MGESGWSSSKTVSIGLPPLNQVLASRVMEETKIYAPCQGTEEQTADRHESLEEVMVRFSNMVADFPEIAEMDINPLVVSEGELYALDTRIIIDPTALEQTEPYPHLVIMPYPTKYVTPWKLKDGTEVMLRPIRPEDEPIELNSSRDFQERPVDSGSSRSSRTFRTTPSCGSAISTTTERWRS